MNCTFNPLDHPAAESHAYSCALTGRWRISAYRLERSDHSGRSRCSAASASYPKRDGFNRVSNRTPHRKSSHNDAISPL